jgi:hypothetical protein
MNHIFKKSANWIAQSYWLIAISVTNDVIEAALKVQKVGFERSLNSIDWIDLITKAILAFAIVQIFKKFNKGKEQISQIKKDYLAHKKKFEEQNYIATLVNLVRLENIVDSKMKFSGENFRLQHLQNMLEKEKLMIKKSLIDLQEHRTVQEIENMISEYYPFNFLEPDENYTKNIKKTKSK